MIPAENPLGLDADADRDAAYLIALEHGARPADASFSALPNAQMIEGGGRSLLFLVEPDPFAAWEEVPGRREAAALHSVGLGLLDHLTDARAIDSACLPEPGAAGNP
ncbi:hypothetical protein [Sphingobium boeckii]|uniref:Uncharacterized protein n=1 Tax=Sphingobium boeckii TaxID=1082345 RepID=A0A7W9AFY6_9SPHN|nr:hypothetical protein [Sphingobium boeckii]MBB5684791.1 hypothetical protein [Sphingobium boeckii]